MRIPAPLRAGIAAAAGIVSLVSCGTSGKAFVDQSVGYAVTRGSVVRMENLVSERNDHLRDGVALRVTEEGCRVSVRMGQPVQDLTLQPGAIIVLSSSGDYVLEPHAVLTDVNGPASGDPGLSSPARPAVPSSGGSVGPPAPPR